MSPRMGSYLRSTAKRLAYWLATLIVLPQLLSYHVRAAVMGRDRALEGSSQALSLIPGLPGQYLRRAFYCRVLAFCHPSVTFGFGVLLSKAGARIDENVYIGPRTNLGLVNIERDALIGPGVQIPSGGSTHGIADTSRPIREQPGELVSVRIGAGAWIGSAAVVLADVGRGSVVAAGSVVNRPIRGGVVAAGVPAMVVRERGQQTDANGG